MKTEKFRGDAYKLSFLTFTMALMVACTSLNAQATVSSTKPSISKPDRKHYGIASFNTSQLLLENHTISSKFPSKESVVSIGKSHADSTRSLIQVFPWTSTVRLKEIGLLLGFEETDYRETQQFRLALYEWDNGANRSITQPVYSEKVKISPESIKSGHYLSIRFTESLGLVKGKYYALVLCPEQPRKQTIDFQLSERDFIGFSTIGSDAKPAFTDSSGRRPDLNLYLVAE